MGTDPHRRNCARIKRNKERHQLVTNVGFFGAGRFQRKVERIAGDLPEVCMSLLGRAKPRILQLLVSPEGLVSSPSTFLAADAKSNNVP